MKITMELNDLQLENILNQSSSELRREDPNFLKAMEENTVKLIGLIDSTITDENKHIEVRNALAEYAVSMKMTHSKIGIRTGINLAKGNIEMF